MSSSSSLPTSAFEFSGLFSFVWVSVRDSCCCPATTSLLAVLVAGPRFCWLWFWTLSSCLSASSLSSPPSIWSWNVLSAWLFSVIWVAGPASAWLWLIPFFEAWLSVWCKSSVSDWGSLLISAESPNSEPLLESWLVSDLVFSLSISMYGLSKLNTERRSFSRGGGGGGWPSSGFGSLPVK